ncbi:hypothetical protein [Azospirillum doebereinerae]
MAPINAKVELIFSPFEQEGSLVSFAATGSKKQAKPEGPVQDAGQQAGSQRKKTVRRDRN